MTGDVNHNYDMFNFGSQQNRLVSGYNHSVILYNLLNYGLSFFNYSILGTFYKMARVGAGVY